MCGYYTWYEISQVKPENLTLLRTHITKAPICGFVSVLFYSFGNKCVYIGIVLILKDA